jgi:hypothetical protein
VVDNASVPGASTFDHPIRPDRWRVAAEYPMVLVFGAAFALTAITPRWASSAACLQAPHAPRGETYIPATSRIVLSSLRTRVMTTLVVALPSSS